MIHVIVSRQIKLITENSQRELIVNILIKKKKKKNLSRIEGIWNDKERKCTQESLYEDNVD